MLRYHTRRLRSLSSALLVSLIIVVIISTLLPQGSDSKFIRIKKKKIKLATQAASALVLLRKPKKLVLPLPVPLPLPIPIITKHDPVIHPIDPLQYLAFEKGLFLSGLGGLPGGFSTWGRR